MRAPKYSRADEAPRSQANCATRAISRTASVVCWSSSATAIAGPIAYQPSAITTASRSGCARRRSRSGSSPSTPPSVTSSGTAAAGVRNSIGTNTICVGRMRPVPSWKRTRRTSAYDTTSSVAVTTGSGVAVAPITAATRRNTPAAANSTVRSVAVRRRATAGFRRSRSDSASSAAVRTVRLVLRAAPIAAEYRSSRRAMCQYGN